MKTLGEKKERLAPPSVEGRQVDESAFEIKSPEERAVKLKKLDSAALRGLGQYIHPAGIKEISSQLYFYARLTDLENIRRELSEQGYDIVGIQPVAPEELPALGLGVAENPETSWFAVEDAEEETPPGVELMPGPRPKTSAPTPGKPKFAGQDLPQPKTDPLNKVERAMRILRSTGSDAAEAAAFEEEVAGARVQYHAAIEGKTKEL